MSLLRDRRNEVGQARTVENWMEYGGTTGRWKITLNPKIRNGRKSPQILKDGMDENHLNSNKAESS